MKPIFENPLELANYFDFVVMSDEDAIRLDKAWNIYLSNYKGDGCMGCVAEMLTATAGSKKATISNAGKIDCRILYRSARGYVIPMAVERKHNGGRIRTFESEYSKAEEMVGRYVVYHLDICNSNTQYLRRYVPAVVIPRTLFVAKLNEFNAIKAVNRNHVLEGYGIQCSSKKWFQWLAEYPIVYDRNAVYCDDDFEGLE